MRKLIFGGRLLVSKPPCKQGPPLSCLRLRSFFPVSSVQNVTKRSGIFAEPLLCDIQPHSCRSFMLVALSLALSLPPHRALIGGEALLVPLLNAMVKGIAFPWSLQGEAGRPLRPSNPRFRARSTRWRASTTSRPSTACAPL